MKDRRPIRLTCYAIHGGPEIVPAPIERDWMNATAGFAYRCLPMNIANSHGWMILNAAPFTAVWNGGAGLDAITVRSEGAPLLATSHFGFGVLTFHIHAVFRTDPGYDLVATGPFNSPKDGIAPLTGIIETDWSESTFTMNWRFTRPHAPVTWERGEPFCMIFPMPRGLIEQVEPDMRPIESDPDLVRAFASWSAKRDAFNAALRVSGSAAQARGWEKDYFRGAGAPPDHRTKLRPKPMRRGSEAENNGRSRVRS